MEIGHRERQNETGSGARAVADIRGCVRKRQTKGLSLTERRLSFAFAEEPGFMRFPLRGNGVIKKSICSGLMRTYVLMSLTGRCRIITIQHSIPASRREPLWGSPIPHWVGRAGHGQNAGQRSPKGRTKHLTFTEGRLRLTTSNAKHLTSKKSLPDLKVRRLGWPCGGPMVFYL